MAALGRGCRHLLCGFARRAFRQAAQVDGVTIVATEKAALTALEELERLQKRPHAWDTETADVEIGAKKTQSPVNHGRVVCATCFCGDDADFGSGPRLFIDNSEGLLERFKPYFEDSQFKKIFHHYSFDRHMLRRHNIALRGFHADTMHMARLWDTSRASWEGIARAKLGMRAHAPRALAAVAQSLAVGRPVAASSSRGPRAGDSLQPSRAILGVKLGATTLEPRAWASQSALHTQSLPEMPAGDPPRDPQQSLKGYGLKSLAAYFGLSESASDFGRLFGTHASAALEAHNSPERFTEFVQYATTDAQLTLGVYECLRKELELQSWYSDVHKPPIEEVVLNPRIISELRRKKRPTYGSEQFNTGKTLWSLYELYLRDMGNCLADMEEVGVGVDLDYLKRIEEQASEQIQAHSDNFSHTFSSLKGPDGNLLNPDAGLINVRSAPQIRQLLFGGVSNRLDDSTTLEEVRDWSVKGPKKKFTLRSLGLKPRAKKKDYSQSGWPKVSSVILDEFAKNPSLAYAQLVENGFEPQQASQASEGLKLLSEVKRVKSLLTGFAQPFRQFGLATGRIHPQWQWDTSTGRLACRSPNLQNLPHTELQGGCLRDAFRPPPGRVFVVADYSQLELRVLAHVANCHSMIEKLLRCGDYHSEVAAEMFPHVSQAVKDGQAALAGGQGVPTVKEMFSKERSKAKAVNFGIIYGMGAGSLSENVNVSKQEAASLIEAWLRSKPEVRNWMESVKRTGYETQHVVSMLGRRRHLPFMDKGTIKTKASATLQSASERAAVNFVIQGSAADIVLAAMLRLWRHPWLAENGFRVVMQLHDEFVVEGPEDLAEQAAELVRSVMMQPFEDMTPGYQFRVPLLVDVGLGKTFGGAKP